MIIFAVFNIFRSFLELLFLLHIYNALPDVLKIRIALLLPSVFILLLLVIHLVAIFGSELMSPWKC